MPALAKLKMARGACTLLPMRAVLFAAVSLLCWMWMRLVWA